MIVAALAAALATTGPLALQPGTSAGGYPLGSSGPKGVEIRFIDRGTLWIAVLVRNRSRQPVTILSAATPEPVGALADEWHAGFSRYTPCTGNLACPWPDTPTSTRPLVLPPHALAAVKLDYRLVSCLQAAAATTASGDRLVVTYRRGAGSVQSESMLLGGARLRPQRPAGEACVPRPYSHIGLVGSFTTSPGHQPIPGSDGDTCTTSAGGLSFRSREFMDRSGAAFYVEIALGRYHGAGSYRPATVTAVAGVGPHGWTTFRDDAATVSVTTATGKTRGGRFSAVFSGHRTFFRAYGAWRCALR